VGSQPGSPLPKAGRRSRGFAFADDTPAASQALLLLSFAGRAALGLALAVVLGRALSTSMLGFVTLVGTLYVVSESLAGFGSSNLAIVEISRDGSRERPLLEGLIAWRALVAGVFGLALGAFAVWESDVARRSVLFGMAVLLPLSASMAMSPVFLVRQKMKGPVLVAIGAPGLFLVACVGLLRLDAPESWIAWLVVARQNLVFVATGLLAWRLLGYWPRPGLTHRGLAPFARAALLFGAAVLVHRLYLSLDILFVRMLRGGVELGAYAAASRPLSPLMPLPWLLLGPVLPLLGEGTATSPAPRLRWQITMLFAAVGALAAGGGVGFAPDILALLYGGRYSHGELAASGAFGWLAVALGVSFWMAPMTMSLMTAGRERTLLRLACAGLGANVVANTLLIPRLGFTGAAAALAITESLVAVGTYLALRRIAAVRPEASDLLALVPGAALLVVGSTVEASAAARLTLAVAASCVGVVSVLRTPLGRDTLRALSARR